MTSPQTKREWALWAAERGFWVFPVIPDTKKPAFKGWQQSATRDSKIITQWWDVHPNDNIGYYTEKFGDTEALVVLDVDVKLDRKGQNGYHTLFQLQLDNDDLPDTFSQDTPSGGAHFCFRLDTALRSSIRKLGPGFDVISSGKYIVGAGSTLQGKAYTPRDRSVLHLPTWITSYCSRARNATKPKVVVLENIDKDRAEKRAVHYLTTDAPIAVKGEGGDQTTFKVAATLKDLGIPTPEIACSLMLCHWNDRCPPGWSADRLLTKCQNAYGYGEEPIGASAPETQFEKLDTQDQKDEKKTNPTENSDIKGVHPFDKLNEEFAFVMAGGGHKILWETTDDEGNYLLEHIQESSFHKKFAAQKMTIANGKTYPISELWMESPTRRSYDGIVFAPGRKCSPRFFNLWRDFSVKPSEKKETQSEVLKSFLSHIKENICQNDPTLTRWLIGYFAHIIQFPEKKHHTSVVFKGPKGVGKSAVTDIVGHLLGESALSVAKKRYITGNFNSHLERCLMVTLEEAFWSGDKETDGILKDLITGRYHMIERKNQEPYRIKNITRVCILGNEDWIVPASEDERRYAVFKVGEGRKQDIQFFNDLYAGMENGGYSELLRYLLDFDLSGLSFFQVPQTEGLHEQKLQSLGLVHQWWRDSLQDGELVELPGDETWPNEIRKEMLRDAFSDYLRRRQIRSRIPDERTIGKQLKQCVRELTTRRITVGHRRAWVYTLPTLETARQQWDRFIGHKTEWNTE